MDSMAHALNLLGFQSLHSMVHLNKSARTERYVRADKLGSAQKKKEDRTFNIGTRGL